MSVPIAIIDYRAPKQAIEQLRKEFVVYEFCNSATYKAICGHPDICVFQGESGLVLAPNSPVNLIRLLEQHNVTFSVGNKMVGTDVDTSTAYNCVETDTHIIHKQGYADTEILHVCSRKPLLSVPQAYTRCSMLYLGSKHCITSDKGIETQLRTHGYDVLSVSPQGILLPPYSNGFIGGCFGVFHHTVYCIGNLSYYSDGANVKEFLNANKCSLVELYEGSLYDGGGLFFIE